MPAIDFFKARLSQLIDIKKKNDRVDWTSQYLDGGIIVATLENAIDALKTSLEHFKKINQKGLLFSI